MKTLSVLLFASMGCAAGGGPFVGYGMKHGPFWGAEAGAGWFPAQLALGMQSRDRLVYGRLDATANDAAWGDNNELVFGPDGLGARLGGGYGRGATTSGGVFAAGLNLGFMLRDAPCSSPATVGVVSFEFRYAGGEMQWVAMTRVEAQGDICNH